MYKQSLKIGMISGIVFFVTLIIWFVVLASFSQDVSNLKSQKNQNQLTAPMWDKLLDLLKNLDTRVTVLEQENSTPNLNIECPNISTVVIEKSRSWQTHTRATYSSCTPEWAFSTDAEWNALPSLIFTDPKICQEEWCFPIRWGYNTSNAQITTNYQEFCEAFWFDMIDYYNENYYTSMTNGRYFYYELELWLREAPEAPNDSENTTVFATIICQ